MSDMDKYELRQFLVRKIAESRADLSGTNEYHSGVECAYDNVLEWLDERE